MTALTLRPIDAPDPLPGRNDGKEWDARMKFALLRAAGVSPSFEGRLWAAGEVDGRTLAMVSGFRQIEVYARREVGADLLGVVIGTASALQVEGGQARVALMAYGPRELHFQHDPAEARWFAVDLPDGPTTKAGAKAQPSAMTVTLVEHPAVRVGRGVTLGKLAALHAHPPAVTAWAMDPDAPATQGSRDFVQAGTLRSVMPLGDDYAVAAQGAYVGERKAGVTLFGRDAGGWQALDRVEVSATAEALRDALAGDEELSAFLLCDAERAVLEVHRGGVRVSRGSLFPLLCWRGPEGRTLTRGESPQTVYADGEAVSLDEVVEWVADGAVSLSLLATFPALGDPSPSAQSASPSASGPPPEGWEGDFFNGRALERALDPT